TTSVVGAPNPSTYGQSVTFTAMVSSTAGTPSGTVTFFDGATQLGTGPLTAGVATYTTPALATGTHSVTARFAAAGNFAGSTSSAATQPVAPAGTTTGVVVAPSPSTFGQSVTYTATVSSAAGTPTVTVTFFDGATQLGTGSLSA